MHRHSRLGPFRLDVLAGLVSAAWLLTAPSGEAASVIGLSVSKASRSEYVAISGSGFGATQGGGLVLIDNTSAVVSTWSDARIIAYVPQTVIGNVGVQVVTAKGSSNVVDLEVVDQQPVGHVRWRAKVDSDYILHRAAIGPDGTVYANAVNGKTYAWTADGGLKWVVQAGIRGGYGPVTVGADGTIYVASLLPTGPAVIALNPNGSQKWQFIDPDSNSVRAGPNVGPDGNLYVIFNTSGTASTGFNLASLSPTGQLRWFRREGFRRTGSLGKDLVFGAGSEQLYFSFWSFAYPFGALFAYDFDGNQRFAIPPTCCPVPAVGPDENVHSLAQSFTPQGDLLWTFPLFGQGPTQNPDVGPDNVHYVVQNYYRLYAIKPNGTENWHYDDSDAGNGFHILFEPLAGPLNNLVLLGGRITYGAPGFFIAVDAATGSLAWRETLPVEPGFAPYGQVVPTSPPLFSADGLTAYIAADVAGDGASPNPYSYFYALDTSGGAGPTPDFSVSVAPPSLSIVRGTSRTASTTVTSLNGFSSPVSLSAQGLPAGVTASFSPNPVTPPGGGSADSTLTLTASASATVGTVTLTIRGTSGSTTHDASLSLTITSPPAVVVVFYDGAESASSTFLRTSNSNLSQWLRNGTAPYAGSFRWKGGSVTGSPYGPNADLRLTTPVLDLSSAASATLTYASQYSTEAGHDFFEVRISTDGGTTWASPLQVSGRSPGYPSWASPLAAIDLTPYVGQTNLKIQFRLTTDAAVGDFGVALDEVQVTKQ